MAKYSNLSSPSEKFKPILIFVFNSFMYKLTDFTSVRAYEHIVTQFKNITDMIYFKLKLKAL